MKILVKTRSELQRAARWDIDFHLPAEGIKKFPEELLKRVDQVAHISKDKRDPGKDPEGTFQYLDISSVDVTVGAVVNPQDVDCNEAPSRARKVVQAFDLLVSTCRPTRGAIAVVPPRFHNEIASTGFSIVRAKQGVNPYYLHFALRLPSTLEQFRKWSTGSSYPAILDEDVAKTLIPVPSRAVQDEIALLVVKALKSRAEEIRRANAEWNKTLDQITARLTGVPVSGHLDEEETEEEEVPHTIEAIEAVLKNLPRLDTDRVIPEQIELDDL